MAEGRADLRELPGQFVEAVGLRLDQRDAQAAQLRLHGRADAVRPEQDQIRLQAEQHLQIELAVTAEGRQVLQARRTRTAVEHADQALAGAQLDDDLAQRRRQRHHPPHALVRPRRQAGQHNDEQNEQQQERRPARRGATARRHQSSWRGRR